MLSDLFSPSLDYSHVDGIGRARQRGVVPNLGDRIFRGCAIGPLIELGQLATVGDIVEPELASRFDAGSLSPFLTAIAQPSEQWLQSDGRCGLIRSSAIGNETELRSFKIDAHKAARSAGFDQAAALLIAALGELIGNILDHSQAEKTGIAAFLVRPQRFEFVVADLGIGVLNSLHQSDDYLKLGDEGEALAAMVETGVSRHGANSGHGNGFRPVFEKLADMHGHLRFRSGDHALTLDGRFGDRVGRQISQRPLLRGFLAAVSCQSTKP